jgi:subtilisin family serine protease
MIQARAVSCTALALMLAGCGESTTLLSTSDEPATATPTPENRRAAAPGTMTLITGDRVILQPATGDRAGATKLAPPIAPRVIPGPGRSKMAFTIEQRNGELTVMPRDMAALVASGQLDPQLFNVTRLIADGFGDDKRRDLPLVVTGPRDAAGFSRPLASPGLEVGRTLSSLHATAVRQDKGAMSPLLTSLVAPTGGGRASRAKSTASTKIWLDRPYKPVLDTSVAQIGDPAAHARGLTGAGVTVAVLDTGIDASHPDLAGKVAAAESFVDDGLGSSAVLGHATHIAPIIAGSGAAAGGQVRGVAPDATLVSGRVCVNAFGDSACPLSSILAGMEWAVVQQGARIVSLSLASGDSSGDDPLEDAINQLSAEHGALFVVAGGGAEAALTVGAIDRDGERAPSSGQGPRVGAHGRKPDLIAPSAGIVGAAALVLQQHPDWTGAQVKSALVGAADPDPTPGSLPQGAGQLDVDRATRQAVLATPASLNLDVATFPHGDDPVQVRTVHYRNAGAAPVALTLRASLNAPDGSAAAAGAIAISASQLTLPAGGSADVVVTVDTSKDGPDGSYRGALTATGDGVRVVTPLGVEREAAAFDLTLNVLDTAGNAVGGTVILVGADPGTGFVDDFITGPTTYHLPAGRYLVWTFDLNSSAILVAPRFALTSDSALVMDGRRARPFDVDVVGQHLALTNLAWVVKDIPGRISLSASGGALPIQAGQIGADAPPGEISSTASASLVPVGEPTSPSAVYNVARFALDQFFTGWKQTLRGRDFATVQVRTAGAEGTQFTKSAGAIPPDNNSLSLLGVSYVGPFETTEHYYGPGFQWFTALDQGDDFGFALEELSQIAEYRAGQTTTESWNRAPLAPAFSGIHQGPFGVLGSPRREGDLIFVEASMFSDQGNRARDSGIGFADTTHARLLRDGEVIEDIDSLIGVIFAAPEAAEYRLEQEVTRPGDLFELSTEVTAAWTFRTQHAEGAFEALPLPSLRFSPDLDDHNQTRARALVLPIHVERVAGAPAPRIATISVDVSFDDGASWAHVPLLVFGADALGLIVHPPGATHVSLRGATADVQGNAAELKVIRAYGLAPR